MLGTSLQWGPGHQGDRSYIAVKPRRNHRRQHQRSPQRSRCNPSTAAAGVSPAAPPVYKDGGAVAGVADSRDSNNEAGLEEPPSKPLSVAPRPCNLDRFLESSTPSFPAQYLSKVRKVKAPFRDLSLVLVVLFRFYWFSWFSDDD